MKKIIFLLTLINLLFLPAFTYATHMPGGADYAALIGMFGLAVGFIAAPIVVLLHYWIAKNKLTTKKYFRLWLIIFLGTPISLVAILLLILLITAIGSGL